MPPFDVVLADQDPGFCVQFAQEISLHPHFRLIHTAHDGAGALQAMEELPAQFLVMDLVENGPVDAFEVLQTLRGWKRQPRSVILSACAEEGHIARALASGVEYYMMKPLDMPTAMLRLTQLTQPVTTSRWRAQQRQAQVRHQVTELLHALGVPPHLSGFAFLQQAITMVVEDPTLLGEMTTLLYPAVADECNSSWSRVERSMRHAVESTWIKGDLAAIQDLFGHCVDANRGKPTNSSFVARLADHVRMHMCVGEHSFPAAVDTRNETTAGEVRVCGDTRHGTCGKAY